jgi:hypothetical protein
VAAVQRKIVEKPKKEIVPMRYKIDAPEGYAPSSVRKNSKGSLTSARGVNTSGGANAEGTTGDGFSHSNSTSTSQLPNTTSNLSLATVTASASATVAATKQHPDKRVSSAPPPSRQQKIHSREVSVPKLFGEIAHLDNELQVLNSPSPRPSSGLGSFRVL